MVATGGYAASPEMLDKYTKYGIGAKMINVGGPGNTGDGINMLLEVGAVENPNIGTLLLFPFMRDKAIVSETNCAGFQPYLWVDKYGRRFTDERRASTSATRATSSPACRTRCTGRSSARSRSASSPKLGNEVGLGIYINNYAKLPGLPAEIEADAADENRTNVFGAATIEELAGKIGVDPAVLESEVGEYNGYCKAGVDRKFHKLRAVPDPGRGRAVLRGQDGGRDHDQHGRHEDRRPLARHRQGR